MIGRRWLSISLAVSVVGIRLPETLLMQIALSNPGVAHGLKNINLEVPNPEAIHRATSNSEETNSEAIDTDDVKVRRVFSTEIPTVVEATASEREHHKQEQVDRIAAPNYNLDRYPVTPANETHWRKTLWATALLEPQEPYVDRALASILRLSLRSNVSQSQQRTVAMALRLSNQLYLSAPEHFENVGQALQQTLDKSPNARWTAMALSTLSRSHLDDNTQRREWLEQTQYRFPHWITDVILHTTLTDLDALDNPQPLPPLTDVLQWQIAPGELQLYVFCRPDRGILCRALLKDQQGQFVRDETNQLWSVELTGRSLHNLPWNFRNGQTPQGIYRIEGTIPQPDTDFFYAYGFFPLVNLFIPFESGVKAFVPQEVGTLKGGLAAYRQLLPPSWRRYFPIEQSYWAGKLGRGLFRIHGTGEAMDFFKDNRRHPLSAGWNPAIGCFSAKELYNPETGELVYADMPQILDRLTDIAGEEFTGYLLMVELPDEAHEPINLGELEQMTSNR